jgi:hypothetical protein
MPGEGLEQAIDGTSTIVHCATSSTKIRQTDVEGTKRLLRKAARADASNFVFVSIMGLEQNSYLPYYRMKLEVEYILERSPCCALYSEPSSSTISCEADTPPGARLTCARLKGISLAAHKRRPGRLPARWLSWRFRSLVSTAQT